MDEYGSVAGLVTIEDVIEQIIGEIDDEYDVEAEKNIRREGERQFAVQGATRIEEFNEYFGAQFPGRRVRHHCRAWSRSISAACRDAARPPLIDGFEFRVIRADRRRIETLRVTTPARQIRSRQRRRRRHVPQLRMTVDDLGLARAWHWAAACCLHWPSRRGISGGWRCCARPC